MNFNFDTGSIFGGLQTLDVTTLPPLGGQAGVLTIVGDGAITLPQGTSAQYPTVSTSGMFRYNTDFDGLEYFDGTTWQQLSYAAGAVSSFKLTDTSTTPIFSTSPTTSSTGNVAATITLSTQSANTIFAGPTTGAAAQPTFRSLTASDIPAVTNIAGGATGDIVYQTGTNTTGFISPGTTGYALISNGSGVAPSYQAVVNSFSAGTTGFTPNTSTTGAVTLAGTLNVANGGTGVSTFTTNGVIFGNGTSPAGTTAAGVQYNVLTVNALGVPEFGTVNLAQAGTAVTGILPLANGGTNNSLSGSNGSIVYNDGTKLVNSSVGSNNQALISTGAGAPTWLTVSSTVTTNEIVQGDGAGAFTANGATFVGSPTFSGVTLNGTVTNSTDAVTKEYADGLVSGLSWKQAVLAATTGNISLNNVQTIDGIGVTAGNRVLVKNQTDAKENGIYIVSAGSWTRSQDSNTATELSGAAVFVEAGTVNANTAWTQTALDPVIGTDNITWAQFSGQGTYTAGAGLNLSGNQFSVKTDGTTTYINGSSQVSVLSSSTLEQVLLSQGAGNTALWGALPLNNSNSVTGILNPVNGGTGINTSTATNGQILIGNGTGLSLSTITAGAGIGVSNGSGSITISNTGVTSFDAGTTGFTPNTSTTGAVTLAGTLNVANGGTGSTSFTTNGVLFGNGSSIGSTAVGTTGQILVGNTGSAPSWSTLSGVSVTSFQTTLSGLTPSTATTGAITLSGTLGVSSGGTGATTATAAFDNISPTTTAGDLIYNNGATNVRLPVGTSGQVLTVVTGTPTWQTPPPTGVTSFKTTLSGLTPSTATTGDVSLDGTLGFSSGGTGLSTLGSANQFLSVDTTATGIEYKTISAGTGISVTPGVGVLTIANTGVTSVAFSDASTTPIYSVSGSPVTTTGTLTVTLATQAANTVFAGPTTGAAAQPTFRGLVYNDVTSALLLYRETVDSPVSPVITGLNSVAIGSGASASADAAFAVGEGSDARITGQKAYANGSFETAGDAQHGVYVLRNITTDSTVTELFLNGVGASQSIVLPDNSLFAFDIIVAGRRTDSTGGGAGYRFVGIAKKDATSGSITFVGTPSKTIIAETDTPWDANVGVNTSNGTLRILVTGQNAKTIRWVATVQTTEVTN